MRPILLAALALLPSLAVAQAEPPGNEDLVARRAAKLATPVFVKTGFGINLDAALARARSSDRPVFAYFTRSYAT